MYACITTKSLGPTDKRNSRVKATATAGSLTLDWDYALPGAPENHKAAAQALANKLGWIGRFVGGGLPDSSGYAFVIDTGDTRDGFSVGVTPGSNLVAYGERNANVVEPLRSIVNAFSGGKV